MRRRLVSLFVLTTLSGCTPQPATPEQYTMDEANEQVYRRLTSCIQMRGDAGGRYVTELSIAKDGTITRTEVRTPQGIVDARVGSCLRKRLETVRFPSSSEPARVRWEFDYHPVNVVY